MFLDKEIVRAVLEFAPDKMLLHIRPIDLLVTHNWEVVSRIEDPNVGNTQKFWFCELPNFNAETFPFVLVTGRESFNLLNVKTSAM